MAGLLLVLFSHTALAAPAKPAKPARLKVSGYGLIGNLGLKRLLRTLEPPGKKPEFFSADFVEDAALLLAARVKRDGYLQPAITVRLVLTGGGRLEVNADELLDNPLPRPLGVRQVEFYIRKGRLYYFDKLEFEGLTSLTEKQALPYFIETDILIHVKGARIYTPQRLERGLGSLNDLLDAQGYHEARLEVSQLHRDDTSGAVRVRIRVQQGPEFIVRSVHEEFFYQGTPSPAETRTVFPGQPYSKPWLQDFTLSLKTNQFHRGYPDATVQLETVAREPGDHQVELDLHARVESGPQVRVGAVVFQGQKKTRLSFLARRVRVQRGELLDPTRTEQGRFRLAELGSFDTVDLRYRPVEEHTRDVIYDLKEGKTLNLSLLFGWGSYELLRGGFEAEQYNIWGLAHRARLKAVQSFKASIGEFTYTIPDAIGQDVDLFLNASGLRREEVSFTREEYGGGLGAHRFFKALATDLTIRYSYQILNAIGPAVPALASEGVTNPAVGAIITDVKFDRRDNPLYPRRGYKIFTTVESATAYLGGDVNYERVEIWTSWHHPLGGGRYLSLGLSHGADVSFGDPVTNLPFNKRFFPGGENSIRGYPQDEASPRNALGQIVGAETYTLGTVEFEQALTPSWSVVIFSDSLGFAEHIDHYPWDTGLFSVGGGVRWRTLIGPVRLEYGYNLNPRPRDPSGTLQFSFGFPF